mmetsp:Transcript_21979/g.55749  ORF Transcript_21979/g.55749 Transcript_21979/m.55749 type:complete len:219 (+) Transcript_21979:407-1063(+)
MRRTTTSQPQQPSARPSSPSAPTPSPSRASCAAARGTARCFSKCWLTMRQLPSPPPSRWAAARGGHTWATRTTKSSSMASRSWWTCSTRWARSTHSTRISAISTGVWAGTPSRPSPRRTVGWCLLTRVTCGESGPTHGVSSLRRCASRPFSGRPLAPQDRALEQRAAARGCPGRGARATSRAGHTDADANSPPRAPGCRAPCRQPAPPRAVAWRRICT